ncbi:MAG: DUF4446 family protein [Patescibacteria group bacterium]|nr:DUF4446 family protein [Patescibacteria group bacterium]
MENHFFYLVIILTIVSVLSTVLGILALIKIRNLQQLHRKLFTGKKAKNLEGLMLELTEKTDGLDKDIESLFDASNQINKLSLKGLNKVGLVRFNPFGEKGHKGCFSLALFNEKQKGIILSTLSTESGTKIFVKKVINGKSDIQLTKEERKAAELAGQSLANN